MTPAPIGRAEVEAAARDVHAAMPPTPQVAWPLLEQRAGCTVWVKHENHTPTGAFKVRGGLHLVARMLAAGVRPPGLASATRGNHGQSLAYATRGTGLACTIVVPHGNSPAKNAAMRAFGAELVEHGRDFDEARVHAHALARARGLRFVGPFERDLVVGVATYALEFLTAVPDLDRVYVPIGCGSGICGMIAMRDALGLATRIVGVVSAGADAYLRSFRAGRPVETPHATTIADGMAVRVPVPEALAIILRGAEDVVAVGDDEVAGAMRALFDDTHQVAEGAGAAPLAAALKWDGRAGRRVGVVLSGGNVDRALYAGLIAQGSSP